MVAVVVEHLQDKVHNYRYNTYHHCMISYKYHSCHDIVGNKLALFSDSPSPLPYQVFMCNFSRITFVRACENVRKGEGEPGNKVRKSVCKLDMSDSRIPIKSLSA